MGTPPTSSNIVGTIVIDPRGLIRSFDKVSERIFGYTSAELIGRNVSVLMPEPYHSQHDGYLERYQRDAVRNVICQGREVTGKRKDQSHFAMWLAVNDVQVGDAHVYVGTIIDLTEQKRLDANLASSLAINTAILQTAVNGIITIDARGIVQMFNPGAEKLFGWTSAEVCGKNVSLLMDEHLAARHDGFLSRYVQSREARIIGIGREISAQRKDGSLFPAFLSVGHTELAPGQHLFVGFITDITAQKQYETSLQLAKDAAEAGTRAKSSFVANMSHEIRTPMNAVIGFSEVVLQDPDLSTDTRRHVKTIYNSAKSLLGIINDVMDVSKLEAGKFRLENVCFHLPNALAGALSTLEHQASDKGLKLSMEYDSSLPERVMGDPMRLRQVVLNLVGNSVKFTDRGSIKLQVRPGSEPGMVQCTVEDTGIGMTPEQCATVFEAFSQADVSTTRRFGGTGLGTTISLQIVELMKGQMGVESTLGQGSRFSFSAFLPQATVTGPCLFEEDDESSLNSYRSPRQFRVLLAEDIETNAVLVMLRLKQQGHEIDWVKNGLEAVQAVQYGQYDLIVMDVMMPVLDGLEATQRIRALEAVRGGHIPILALTASIIREDHEKCIDAGMDRVEAKPINFDQLFLTMEQIVPPGGGHANTGLHKMVPLNAGGADSTVIDFLPMEPVADYARALRTWQDPLAYAKALLSFAERHAQDAARMESALGASPADVEAGRSIAHALKGLAGNLRLTRVTRLAVEIDADLKVGQVETAKARLVDLAHSLGRAQEAIGKLLLPIDSLSTPVTAVDSAEIAPLLAELSSALEQLNPDTVEPLLARLGTMLSRSDLAPIASAVEVFDFDLAQAHTTALKNKLSATGGEQGPC